MTALERLIKAEGVQGGTIHDYNRRFNRALKCDVSEYSADQFSMLGAQLLRMGELDLARLASKASIAHLEISRVAS